MDRGYFDDNETQDMLLLRKLSTDVGMFTTVGECEKYACADASGITKDGKIAIVELKNRYNEIQDFGDIFIESKKVAYLLLEHITKGHIPLYINFFTVDGITKHAAVWNLLNVTDFKYYSRIRTHSNGYQAYEHRERFGLLYSDAWIYEIRDDDRFKLLKRGGKRTKK